MFLEDSINKSESELDLQERKIADVEKRSQEMSQSEQRTHSDPDDDGVNVVDGKREDEFSE